MELGSTPADAPAGPPSFSQVLRSRPFAVLFAAETQSIVGDQLARVALSVLVFRRTNSASATVLTYAATYLPAIFGGFVLAGIGDRLPRQAVLVLCDVARAGLFAAMAIAGLPVGVVVALLVVAVFLGPAFSASEVSYLASALEPELFRVGTGLRMMSNQAAQVIGFGLGGVLVAAMGPRAVLLCDAATYVVSAIVITVALPRGDGTKRRGDAEPQPVDPRAFAGLWRDPLVRALVLLSALAGLFIVPEGLAVPFGVDISASTTQIGIMLAAIPFGGAIGAGLLVRLPHRYRHAASGSMAVGCGVPLVISAFAGHWPVAAVCWLVSGALSAYQVETMTTTVHLIPDAVRARIVGAASSILLGAQGVGLLAFAGVARYATPAHAIALAGLIGSALALLLVLGPLRRRRASASATGTRTPTAGASRPYVRSHGDESTARPGP
jgi:predicted MFS family arabinose efflux permease